MFHTGTLLLILVPSVWLKCSSWKDTQKDNKRRTRYYSCQVSMHPLMTFLKECTFCCWKLASVFQLSQLACYATCHYKPSLSYFLAWLYLASSIDLVNWCVGWRLWFLHIPCQHFSVISPWVHFPRACLCFTNMYFPDFYLFRADYFSSPCIHYVSATQWAVP